MRDTQIGILWLLLHIALGAVAAFFPVVVAGWLGCVVVGAVIYALRDGNRAGSLHLAACYLCAYEVLARMTNAPLPWQTGTYIGIPLLLLGLAMGRKLRTLVPGLILVGLLTPALLQTDYSRDIRDTLVFNWAGIMILALSMMYFYRRVLLEENVVWMLRAIAGPVVAAAVVSTISTPDLASIEFTLSANRETVGFGSNQMATIFGMGIVALAAGFFMNRALFGFQGVDFVLTVYLFFRALISFSRGGLISAMIASFGALAVIVWAYARHQNIGQTVPLRRLLLIPLVVPAFGLIFLVTDQITGGMLSLRYRGETAGTLAGDREMTLKVATSGRSEIVRTDLEMWYDHFFLGVGPGNSAQMRPDYGYHRVAPHTEYSRLLAEHGLLGLIVSLIIILLPLKVILNPRYPVVGRALLAAFTLFSLTVMGHSATRLFGTTYLYGIGWALIVPKDVLLKLAANHPVLRKQLIRLLGRARADHNRLSPMANAHGARNA